MALSDYAHHNEEAQRIWWEEEGRWENEPRDTDPDDESWRDEPESDEDEED